MWKPEKNEMLKRERDISFEEIAEALASGGFKYAFEYVGTKEIHKGQLVLVVEVDGDEWRVPATVTKIGLLLRTAY